MGHKFSASTPGSRTRSLVLCGLSIALLSVGAAIQLPFGPVPFTLQTLMLILLLLVLTPAEALGAVGGYLVLGAVGLPLFAGFRGGFGVLLGPTGGFLTGFFIAAFLAGCLRVLFGRRTRTMRASLLLDVSSIIVITLASYAVGSWWFAFSTNTTMSAAFMVCVAPFLVPDILKAIAAFVCAQPIRIALGRATWQSPSTPSRSSFEQKP
jgi:biotin transport system substrate-specific component